MQQQRHDWLFKVFSDIHSYSKENGLEHSAAEVQIPLAVEKELGGIVEFPTSERCRASLGT